MPVCDSEALHDLGSTVTGVPFQGMLVCFNAGTSAQQQKKPLDAHMCCFSVGHHLKVPLVIHEHVLPALKTGYRFYA